MHESAGHDAAANDRFRGFVPSEIAAGEMDLERIIEDAGQPRKTYHDEALRGLAENIKTHGVQQAIQLRWSEVHGKWLIVYGHRRYRAAKLAGLTTIPCTFAKDDLDETTIRIRQLIENCQREDLAPMEMARAMEALSTATGWSNRRLGEELGISHVTIARYRDLLELPQAVQQQVTEKKLAPSVAVEVLRIEDPEKQAEVGRAIATEGLNRSQAKARIDAAADRSQAPVASRPREKELLTQTVNIAIYRNPDVNDLQIQKELLAAAAQLDVERLEA
jgi:ParB family chromosome partitioning protein